MLQSNAKKTREGTSISSIDRLFLEHEDYIQSVQSCNRRKFGRAYFISKRLIFLISLRRVTTPFHRVRGTIIIFLDSDSCVFDVTARKMTSYRSEMRKGDERKRWKKEETRKNATGSKEMERKGSDFCGEALALVAVNPTVSLISRPAAIRFATRSSVSSRRAAGQAAASFSFLDLFHQLSPFVSATTTTTMAAATAVEPMARIEIPTVSEEKQSKEDFSVPRVVARDGARRSGK